MPRLRLPIPERKQSAPSDAQEFKRELPLRARFGPDAGALVLRGDPSALDALDPAELARIARRRAA